MITFILVIVFKWVMKLEEYSPIWLILIPIAVLDGLCIYKLIQGS